MNDHKTDGKPYKLPIKALWWLREKILRVLPTDKFHVYRHYKHKIYDGRPRRVHSNTA